MIRANNGAARALKGIVLAIAPVPFRRVGFGEAGLVTEDDGSLSVLETGP